MRSPRKPTPSPSRRDRSQIDEYKGVEPFHAVYDALEEQELERTITNKIYDILQDRKDGLSIQTLARIMGLSVGTVTRHIKDMEKDIVVERVMMSDKFVYKLTR